ncbi:hypothetical protein [Blautia sp. MSJ-9]|uniref:hypothetical protein n=1 Tax=Blautia sp. MSJ-9 TaxID=2841511 RepID=UPI001C121265|nr:hypothetical protein [Blautia sp. MSJ-9]MBU5680087.1 hypothetical protein [Blautia sp. MSJ-9]
MKLKIIAKLWSAVYDLLFYIDGKSEKSIEQIHNDLDVIEVMCRPYAELYDLEMPEERGGENE